MYSDDDNWASIHMIHAGGQRDFEFIYEAEGNPRNEAADKLGGIPADAPLEYYVRINSDGDELTAEYSYDGVDFEPVGRPASLDTFDNPRIGPTAFSDARRRSQSRTSTGFASTPMPRAAAVVTPSSTSSTAPTSRARRGRPCGRTRA